MSFRETSPHLRLRHGDEPFLSATQFAPKTVNYASLPSWFRQILFRLPALSELSRESRFGAADGDHPPAVASESAGATGQTRSVPSRPSAEFHPYPFYSPRFWHGMRMLPWWRLLKNGGFRVSASRLALASGVSLVTPFNSSLSVLQRAFYRRRLATAEFHGPPVFILGHWRSGTTLLHELMVLDERLSSPSTYQCFAPDHHLVSAWFFCRFARWLLPGKRPMDNMSAGWERPQEDEFALLTLGLPSPYRRIAFPNQGPVDLDYLDFRDLPQERIVAWMAKLRQFLLSVSIATGRPLVVKSPTHTGRIAALAKEFPEARFIHISRDPRSLFPSTCRLWRSLDAVQALQRPSDDQIESYVIECLKRMYDSFHQGREQVEPHRLVDVRYEDLKQDPVGTLGSIYETLRLSDFEPVQPAIQQWVEAEHSQYQTNQHQLSPEHESLIRDAWRDYFDRYGY